jgi:hypothetical protein
VDPARWYTIAELSQLIGGSDRLYRGEIAAKRLPAIKPGKEFRVLGEDALTWARRRAEEHNARRRGRPLATVTPLDKLGS